MSQSYLDHLRSSARQTLAEPRVRGFMAEILKPGVEFPVDQVISSLEKHMREYSQNWATVAAKHEDAGLYKKISEFIGAAEGLYVDLGCGAGNLLCALPGRLKLIGADINPYLLGIAEANLRKKGKRVEVHSDVRMGFSPGEGLVVQPVPLMQELDFRKVQLISDDISNLNNTKRVLYYQGIKADGAIFTLAGGHTVQRAGEIISALRYLHTGEDTKRVKSLDDFAGPVLRNAQGIVKHGGHIYLAVRGITMEGNGSSEGELKAGELSLADYVKKEHSKYLEVVRDKTIQMLDERGHEGIDISHHISGNEEVPDQVRQKIIALPYQLNLLEIKVK